MRRVFSVLLLCALALVAPLGSGVATAAKSPKRIVSLSPTATEMLFAVGAGKQVVAVDDQSDYPKKAPHTDLSGYQPNVEAIAGYNPDLVVVDSDDVKSQLQSLGIDVLVLPAAKTLDDSYRQIARLGKVTDHASKAAAVVAQMKSDTAGILAKVPKAGRTPSTYWELDDTFFSADSSTFIGKLLHLAGYSNIADQATSDGSGYPQLSAEFVVSADPAVVFLADTKCCKQTARKFGERPGFATVAAVKAHHVVELDDDVASRWGPRVVDLLRILVKERKQV